MPETRPRTRVSACHRARRPPNPFCAKLARSVRAENRSSENAQSASVPPPFPSAGSTPRSFLTPSRHLGPHTQAPRLRPPKPFIWEQQPALYASDRLFESRARAERRASTTLVIVLIYLKFYLNLFDLKLQLRGQLRASASPRP